jgi:hypothetical protein
MISRKYARLINQMASTDQSMRNSKIWDAAIDPINTAKLKEIIRVIGWPTIQKVGRIASWNAWLIAQHADIEFMQYCLALIKNLSADEVALENIEYLEDRVLAFRF